MPNLNLIQPIRRTVHSNRISMNNNRRVLKFQRIRVRGFIMKIDILLRKRTDVLTNENKEKWTDSHSVTCKMHGTYY